MRCKLQWHVIDSCTNSDKKPVASQYRHVTYSHGGIMSEFLNAPQFCVFFLFFFFWLLEKLHHTVEILLQIAPRFRCGCMASGVVSFFLYSVVFLSVYLSCSSRNLSCHFNNACHRKCRCLNLQYACLHCMF
jgi:hypothetical protein